MVRDNNPTSNRSLFDPDGRAYDDDDPELDSLFYYTKRGAEGDSPEYVHMWATAVLRQIDRVKTLRKRTGEMEIEDRHVEYVSSDRWFAHHAEEYTETAFLMEAAVQMLRWASSPDMPIRKWQERDASQYGLPHLSQVEWVSQLRNLIVHYDETFRGHKGSTLKNLDGAIPLLDYSQLERLARAAVASIEQGIKDYAESYANRRD